MSVESCDADDGAETDEQWERECTPFEIQVVDAETGRGVPLIELRTTDGAAYYTDSAGRVALNDPGLFGVHVSFTISSHGYEERTESIAVEPNGKSTVEIERENVAERLYRVTGRDIYRDSVLLGYDVPLSDPHLNSKVTGEDSVHSVVYNDRIYWIWGDTKRVDEQLGNFQATGATSKLPQDGGLDPADGVDLVYFEDDDGFVASMAPLPSDEGNLMWLDRMVTVPDADGQERLVARYSHLAGLHEPLGKGLLVFDDERERFELLKTDADFTTGHGGQATRYDDPVTGEPYWFFAQPWPTVRVPNDFEAVQQEAAYEYFTCLEPGTDWEEDEPAIHRDADGAVVWDWKPNTHAPSQEQERELIEDGLLEPTEARFQLRDVETGDEVVIQRATVRWNDYRQRWISIGMEGNEEGAAIGELWYAEAETPTGPWELARKIVTHDDYSFYNPDQHTFFDQEGGRYIYFEATYTTLFSDSEPTPVYDYNQMMYRLDLEHPRLDLPLST